MPDGELYAHEFAKPPKIYSEIHRKDLLELIQMLPNKNYSTVLLLEYKGLTNGEIAFRLGVNEKYVRDRKSNAKKAIAKLKKKLGW